MRLSDNNVNYVEVVDKNGEPILRFPSAVVTHVGSPWYSRVVAYLLTQNVDLNKIDILRLGKAPIFQFLKERNFSLEEEIRERIESLLSEYEDVRSINYEQASDSDKERKKEFYRKLKELISSLSK